MKTIDEYIKNPYRLEIIPDAKEGGYVGFYPELPGCITCAETLRDLIANIEDCKKEWIEAAMESNIEIPEPEENKYSGQFKLRMPKSLHKTLAENSKREGISMNQYCLYLLTKNDAEKILLN